MKVFYLHINNDYKQLFIRMQLSLFMFDYVRLASFFDWQNEMEIG